MKFEKAKDLDNEKFRRLTGMKRSAFEQMISITKQDKKWINKFIKEYLHFKTFNPFSIYKMIWDIFILYHELFVQALAVVQKCLQYPPA